ncbi:MAG TPA: hypothetical protein VL084_01735 [Thermoanaerobaculia bacterium]|nr:hypothetical protein [Thermoanaerobaculia bacterium]
MLLGASYGYLALLLLAGIAFWPRYLSRLTESIDPYTHAHAVLALLWCLLLICQPFLVRRNRQLHRRVGALSYVLAPSFVVASLLLANARFRAMSDTTFRQEASTLYLPLSAAVLFGVSYGLAIYYRHDVALHARFMVATGLPMIDPVVGRVLFYYGPPLAHPLYIQAITFGLTDLILLGLFAYPSLPLRSRATFALPAAAFPALHLAWFTVVQSSAWVPFASWFRNLPLS